MNSHPSAPYGYGAARQPDGSGFGNMQPGYGAGMPVPVRAGLEPKVEVSVKEAIVRMFKRGFTFKGYASMAEYWKAVLAYLVGLVFFGVMFGVLGPIIERGNGALINVLSVVVLLIALVFVLAMLAALIPMIALQVRRFHDAGKPGWWVLLNLIPGGGIVVLVFLLQPSHPELWRQEWSQ